jgi:hypothetical protein
MASLTEFQKLNKDLAMAQAKVEVLAHLTKRMSMVLIAECGVAMSVIDSTIEKARADVEAHIRQLAESGDKDSMIFVEAIENCNCLGCQRSRHTEGESVPGDLTIDQLDLMEEKLKAAPPDEAKSFADGLNKAMSAGGFTEVGPGDMPKSIADILKAMLGSDAMEKATAMFAKAKKETEHTKGSSKDDWLADLMGKLKSR